MNSMNIAIRADSGFPEPGDVRAIKVKKKMLKKNNKTLDDRTICGRCNRYFFPQLDRYRADSDSYKPSEIQ